MARKKKQNASQKAAAEQSARLLSTIERLLEQMEESIDGKQVKLTIADFIRLVELRNKLDEERGPKEVEVRWVGESEAKPADET